MRLISLKIEARGLNGWESPTLHFGKRTTSLHAANGSGKTPLVQSIAFCLGFDTKFREDIREKCQAAVLTFEHNEKTYIVRRSIGNEFYINFLNSSDQEEREFFSEGEFSSAIFKEFDLSAPTLISNKRQPTQPYISTVLPIFYVKQDGGYIDAYKPPSSFIMDQFVEMVRFAFGLSPKRSYTAQKDLISAKDQLEFTQRKLVFQQKVVSDLSNSVDDSPTVRDELAQRAAVLTGQITDLRETVDAEGAANAALLEILHAKEEKIRATRRIQSELRARIAGFESIRGEIEGEIKTLSLNEESRRAFESFGDICRNPSCGLFLSSSESYAKNLLYLKDQIKDLEANTTRAEIQLTELSERLSNEEADRSLIASKLKQPSSSNANGQLVAAVQSLTKELLEIEQRRAAIANLIEEKRKYIRLDEARFKLQDQIALLSNNGRSDLEFKKLRLSIRESVARWMDILDTLNASRDVEIDLDFHFRFGNEPLDAFTGSTRIRLVLAIHAAIFEHYIQNPHHPFRFLVLDTPKQHELKTDDLARFLGELQELCDEFGGQILISSTEYRHAIESRDIEWLPRYPGEKQPMYLGPVQH